MKSQTAMRVTVIVGIFLAIALTAAVVSAASPVEVSAEPETEIRQVQLEVSTKPDTALDPDELILIARTIWGEAEGVPSKVEQAAVAWCVLNRVDAWGKPIEEIITAPNQFDGYRRLGEVPEEFISLAADVMNRWKAEKAGHKNVGRVLPDEYLYFVGDGFRNYFTQEWLSQDYWDWSLQNPYQ